MIMPYHSGIPDLKPDDTIEPGHSRDNHDDRPIRHANEPARRRNNPTRRNHETR